MTDEAKPRVGKNRKKLREYSLISLVVAVLFMAYGVFASQGGYVTDRNNAGVISVFSIFVSATCLLLSRVVVEDQGILEQIVSEPKES